MDRLKNKVAIITGAASGMGLAAARLFAAEGAKVVLADVSMEALEKTAAEIADAGQSAVAIRLDVSRASDWDGLVAQTIDEFGAIDVLVNNAGVQRPVGVLETTEDDWNFVLNINAKGVWLGTKAVIPHMREAGGGSIVNVSSIAALVGGFSNDGGGTAYSASKGAVRSMTKHIAQAFAADHIRANSIHPGAIYTGMVSNLGISREQFAEGYGSPLPPFVGDPEDIAFGMLYLASDESKFVTGEELVIDGGATTH